MSLQPPLKIFSVEDANRLLPAIRERLGRLRLLQREVVSLQGKVDIEELTGQDGRGGLRTATRTAIEELNEAIREKAESFHEELEEFHALGVELKDLDRGLVDFYHKRHGQLVYLCWHDGEPSVSHWHTLEGGFGAREPLEED